MTGKWLIHLVLRGAAESITSLVLQCLLQRGEQHTGSCRQYLCLAALSLHRPVSVLSHQVLNLEVLKSHRGFQWQYLSHPLLQLIWQFKEIPVHAVSPSQSLRNLAMLRHFWHNRDLCSFPSLVSGLSEELLSCTLTSLALLSQRAEISHQSLRAWRVYFCILTRNWISFFSSSGNWPGRKDLNLPLLCSAVAWMNLLNLSALSKRRFWVPQGAVTPTSVTLHPSQADREKSFPSKGLG